MYVTLLIIDGYPIDVCGYRINFVGLMSCQTVTGMLVEERQPHKYRTALTADFRLWVHLRPDGGSVRRELLL